MSKWLNQFLKNEIVNRSDKSARFKFESNMSPLSLRSQGLLNEKMVNMPEPDITDKTNGGCYLPGLSGFSNGLSGSRPFSLSKGDGLLDEYEERLAIAEYDGHQNNAQAERIAYLDAFVSVLLTLPHEDAIGDWLDQRIKAVQEWLISQGIEQAV